MAFPIIHAEELKAFFDQEMTAWINRNYPIQATGLTEIWPEEQPTAPNVNTIKGLSWSYLFFTNETTVRNAADGSASFQSSQIKSGAVVTGSTIVDLFVGHATLECTRYRRIRYTRNLTGSKPFPNTATASRLRMSGRLFLTYRAPGFANPASYVHVTTNSVIDYNRLVQYIVDIRNEWKRVAYDNPLDVSGTVCHASCHNSCHNSRGRR